MISVIVPIYNEQQYIHSCLESILAQDFPKEETEVFLMDGMSTDRTRELIKPFLEKYTFIKLLDNPKKTAPCAMNIGIKEAKGDYIIRLDAHAQYPKNYFSVLIKYLNELHADNVGAIWHTDVLNKTPKTLAIREVLSSPLGVGDSVFRIGTEKVKVVDTVPFGCWPFEVFSKYGLYDERLTRNQDIEFNKRILRGGGKIYLVPETFCTYFARETFTALAENNFQNGRWNILTVMLTSHVSSLSLRHFVPLIFLLSLIVPAILALWRTPFLLVTLCSLLAYLTVIGGNCIRLAVKKKLHPGWLFFTFLVLHLSYGWGSLVGLWETRFLTKKPSVEI